MDEIVFLELNDKEKILLLDILGFEIDRNRIIIEKESKKPYICPITDEYIRLENASILPGSTIIINTSAWTLAEYFSKFLERE